MVVFDMAGTVVDEGNVVYKTLHKALNDGGVSVTFNEVLADGAGKEKKKAMSDIVAKRDPGKGPDSIDAMYNKFVGMLEHAYNELDVHSMRGTGEVFDRLKSMGVWRVLNTGYSRATALQLIRKLKWERGINYDELVTASDVEKGRPYPDMIRRAMEILGIKDPGSVVKVGDSIIDIEEGKNAGCGMTIAITTGAHTRRQLASACPDHIIDSIDELMPLIALQPAK
jgi:phosphonatase-like hydrolase